ncbi:MAG: NAD synthetase, partial [Zetaproteobacteria bacterium]
MLGANATALSYLAASVLLILALKGLAHPETARRGNVLGMLGMALAIAITLMQPGVENYVWIALMFAAGGAIGWVAARRVPMTHMPQTVALMHSLVGLAAVLIAAAAFADPVQYGIALEGALRPASRVELAVGAVIGAITFTASLVAFGKLQGLLSSKPLLLPGRHAINLALAAVIVGCIAWFFAAPNWTALVVMNLVAFVLGVLLVVPIGGADMPVIVSMLNSYSGWAAAG